ncbi:MAG: phosphoglucomutase [Flavobacteriales bacterium]
MAREFKRISKDYTINMSAEIITKATKWLSESFDLETRTEVKRLMHADPNMLIECFYTDLEFGTGGMRGKMGVGTNRINKYTIGQATQGLANYMKKQFPDANDMSVVIAHDSRNNSPFFSQVCADVLSANGIKAYLFSDLRPTPELSFAVRELGCNAGIVITASHNPKEYNGYKVYWNDGAQIVAPHDTGIISEVRAIESVEEVSFSSNSDLIETLDDTIDRKYMAKVQSLSVDAFKEEKKNLKIVFTSLHGTGITMVPQVLKNAGFENVILEETQAIPSGDFPSVESPNPEERSALRMAMELAEKEGGDLVLGTDPDADRVGLVARNSSGELTLINGNQACALIVYYRLEQMKTAGTIPANGFIAKTVVTSDLISNMAKAYGVKLYETLTGFKWIASVIREKEGKEVFLGGGEESYGYLVGDFVRDKDAVISSLVLSECAAWAASKGKTLIGILDEIYLRFGHFRERLISVVREGKSGKEEIQAMMDGFRTNPPAALLGSKVVSITDILNGTVTDKVTGNSTDLGLPSSNVMQFTLENGLKFTARPSGTEPKIKFYFSVNLKASSNEEILKQEGQMNEMIAEAVKELGL